MKKFETIREYVFYQLSIDFHQTNDEIKKKTRRYFYGSKTSIANIIFYRKEFEKQRPEIVSPLHQVILNSFKKVK